MPRIRYVVEVELDGLLVARSLSVGSVIAASDYPTSEIFIRNAMHQHPAVMQRLEDKLPRLLAKLVQCGDGTRSTIARAIGFELDCALTTMRVFDRTGAWSEPFLRKLMAARGEALAR